MHLIIQAIAEQYEKTPFSWLWEVDNKYPPDTAKSAYFKPTCQGGQSNDFIAWLGTLTLTRRICYLIITAFHRWDDTLQDFRRCHKMDRCVDVNECFLMVCSLYIWREMDKMCRMQGMMLRIKNVMKIDDIIQI